MSMFRRRVYHFRPDKQPRDLETLIAKQLWSSRVAGLNDPFEFAALRALAAHPEKQAEFQSAGVTCFCRSLTNPLLWSHYAASHIGFAIGCDAGHPFFGGHEGVGSRTLLDVRYEDVAPSLDFISVDDLAMAAVLTKPTCWAYEQEVRLVSQQGDQVVNLPPDLVKEVFFGAAMPQPRVEVIMATVLNAGIDVRFGRMRHLAEGYGVKPEWIE
jgi:hypothetical protein